MGPAAIEIEARPGWGTTVVEVPPFGSVSARTHESPLKVTAALTAVDPSRLSRLLERSDSTDELLGSLESGLRRAAVRTAVGLTIFGIICGAVALSVLPGRSRRTMLTGAAGGGLFMLLTLGVTAGTFDPSAFSAPKYSGAIERAPAVLAAVEDPGALKKIPSRFRGAASKLTDLMGLITEPSMGPSDDTVAILHISDVHSNPLGLEIARQLATGFKVAAVIDTGDLTSFGAPIEARIGELVSSIPVPYLFVPGNHDSEQNREALRSVPNVVMLEPGKVHDVAGVRVLGWPDPTFNDQGLLEDDESVKIQRQHAGAVAAAVEELTPNILAVHHPELGRDSIGKVGLILSGHGHVRRARTRGGTLSLQVGSSGATGLGSFLVEADHAYEAQIIHLRAGKPVAVDYIRFKSLGRDFEVDRTLIAE